MKPRISYVTFYAQCDHGVSLTRECHDCERESFRSDLMHTRRMLQAALLFMIPGLAILGWILIWGLQ